MLIELSEAAAARFIYYLGFNIAISEQRYIRPHNKMFRKLPAGPEHNQPIAHSPCERLPMVIEPVYCSNGTH